MTLGLEFPTQRTQKMKPKQGFESSPRLLDCSLTQTLGPKQVRHSKPNLCLSFQSPRLCPRAAQQHLHMATTPPNERGWPLTGLCLAPWLGPWVSEVKDDAICSYIPHTSPGTSTWRVG